MINPFILASTPFRNPTAFRDLVGTVYLYHAVLAQTISRTTGKAVKLYPIGNGGGAEWLQALQAQHQDEATALGLGAAPNLTDYILSDPSDWASFTFTLSQDLQRLRIAAGLT